MSSRGLRFSTSSFVPSLPSSLFPNYISPQMDTIAPSSSSSKRALSLSPDPEESAMNDAPIVAPESKKVKLSEEVVETKLKSLLPPSTFLFRGNRPLDGSMEATRPPIETDVGILEYVGRDIAPFQGIIKQRSVHQSSRLVSLLRLLEENEGYREEEGARRGCDGESSYIARWVESRKEAGKMSSRAPSLLSFR